MNVNYKKLDPRAHGPHRAHPGDLGYDLFALHQTVIEPGLQEKIHTGISIEFPAGWGAVIKDRSSMAAKGLYTSAGVIDQGYRGEIIVLIRNSTKQTVTIRPGDKVAQLVPIPVTDWNFGEAENVDETHRGAGGFGSTGSGI